MDCHCPVVIRRAKFGAARIGRGMGDDHGGTVSSHRNDGVWRMEAGLYGAGLPKVRLRPSDEEHDPVRGGARNQAAARYLRTG